MSTDSSPIESLQAESGAPDSASPAPMVNQDLPLESDSPSSISGTSVSRESTPTNVSSIERSETEPVVAPLIPDKIESDPDDDKSSTTEPAEAVVSEQQGPIDPSLAEENETLKKPRLSVPDLVKPKLKRRRRVVDSDPESDLERHSELQPGMESCSPSTSLAGQLETANLDASPSDATNPEQASHETAPLADDSAHAGLKNETSESQPATIAAGDEPNSGSESYPNGQELGAEPPSPLHVSMPASESSSKPEAIETNVAEPESNPQDQIEAAEPAVGVDSDFDSKPLQVPQPIAKIANARSENESGSVDEIEPVPFLKSFSPVLTKPLDEIPIINLSEPAENELFEREEVNWEQRLQNANSDRKILARFFAICLCFVAIINMTPALYHWYHWLQLAETMPLPRWIYILVFVGAIHLVYAIFLFQINDWSAMRAVSIAMLVVAFVFGFISTGLLVGEGQGNVTGFLGIPFTLNRQACIWCVAMLCLATLMSYWGGKESSNWQRTDVLLKDILAKNSN